MFGNPARLEVGANDSFIEVCSAAASPNAIKIAAVRRAGDVRETVDPRCAKNEAALANRKTAPQSSAIEGGAPILVSSPIGARRTRGHDLQERARTLEGQRHHRYGGAFAEASGGLFQGLRRQPRGAARAGPHRFFPVAGAFRQVLGPCRPVVVWREGAAGKTAVDMTNNASASSAYPPAQLQIQPLATCLKEE
jgi:hypothetical protein